jgi:hypothetical protein
MKNKILLPYLEEKKMYEAKKTHTEKILTKLARHSSFDLNSKTHNAEQKKDDSEEFVEGGLGWLILLATIWSYGVIIGMQNNYSILYLELIQVYNTTKHNVLYSGK